MPDMGEQDIALDWLETAIRTHQAAAPFAVLEYRFQSLRQFPRFRAMIQQLGPPDVSFPPFPNSVRNL